MSSSAHLFTFLPSLAKLAALTLVLAAAAPASAQTPVTFGATISEPGFYFLAGHQSGTGADGITIESDDVVLFLSRFTLRGDGHAGIRCEGNDNVTIWGGRVTGFVNGVIVRNCTGCTVKDMRIDHSAGDGLLALAARESWFLRLQCDHNGRDGVNATECTDSRFISIRSHDNRANGFLINESFNLTGSLGNANGNKFRLCWAAYNELNGIHVEIANGDEIVKNQCVNNGEAGIRLGEIKSVPCLGCLGDDQDPPAEPAVTDVLVTSNWCVFNHVGIAVDVSAQGNTLTSNTALANFAHDLVEDNGAQPCANTWILNVGLTRHGDGAICTF